MNWKKFFAALVVTSTFGGLQAYVGAAQSGHPIAFTFGNVGVPMLISAANGLIHLFQTPPTQDVNSVVVPK